MAFDDAVLADNPVIYLRCNEVSGTQISDSSGGGHHGAISGGYALGAAPMRDGTIASISFSGDGTTGRIIIPAFGGFAPAGDYTIEFIARWTNGSRGIVFHCVDGSNVGPSISVSWSQAGGNAAGIVSLRDQLSPLHSISAGTDLNDGQFRLIHMIRRGLDLEIWIAGQLANVVTMSSAPAMGTPSDLYLMSGASNIPVFGALDELAFYHHALSPERIERHAVLAQDLWELRGNATLDTGTPATRVVARKWVGHDHAGVTIPAPNGDFVLYLAAGLYDVTVFGPEGYQPITHGPVETVELN